MTRAEQETVIRWDQEERIAHLYTAYAPEALKWARQGFVVEIACQTNKGEPRGWTAQAELKAVRLRKVCNGRVLARPRGRSFLGSHAN